MLVQFLEDSHARTRLGGEVCQPKFLSRIRTAAGLTHERGQ